MRPLDGGDVTAPQSRHNRHVTTKADIVEVDPWSRDQLYAAVKQADTARRLVVVDYGRENLYLADAIDLAYTPPRLLGIAADPALRVTDPALFDPEAGTTSEFRSVTVAPAFDILIPAFDWDEPDDDWKPIEPEYRDRPAGSPSGAVGG